MHEPKDIKGGDVALFVYKSVASKNFMVRLQ